MKKIFLLSSLLLMGCNRENLTKQNESSQVIVKEPKEAQKEEILIPTFKERFITPHESLVFIWRKKIKPSLDKLEKQYEKNFDINNRLSKLRQTIFNTCQGVDALKKLRPGYDESKDKEKDMPYTFQCCSAKKNPQWYQANSGICDEFNELNNNSSKETYPSIVLLDLYNGLRYIKNGIFSSKASSDWSKINDLLDYKRWRSCTTPFNKFINNYGLSKNQEALQLVSRIKRSWGIHKTYFNQIEEELEQMPKNIDLLINHFKGFPKKLTEDYRELILQFKTFWNYLEETRTKLLNFYDTDKLSPEDLCNNIHSFEKDN